MLARKSYPQEYIDACRAQVDAQFAAYDALAAAVGDGAAQEAFAQFEPQFARSVILDLELMFVHRLRGAEGKDGNPINEVRTLASSILEHDGEMHLEDGIKMRADRSILGIPEGEQIVPTLDKVKQLASAYFSTIVDLFAE